jgi:signal transduction histidine kinase
MKIRTQLILSIAFFGLVLILISISVVMTNQQVDRMNGQETIATDIELGAGDLNYLSSEYLLYNESQQIERWDTKYSEISFDLSNLAVNQPDQQALVADIRANQQRLKEVFDDVRQTKMSGLPDQNSTSILELTQVSWSRMAVQNQDMSFDASRLSGMLRNEENQAELLNTILIFSLIGTFMAFLFINYMIIYRRTLKSISALQAGTRIIGSGNLDYSIEEQKDNEFGELSHAFNQMTRSLKAVTASKADIEGEIAERKRVENELRESKAQAELYLDLMGHDINNINQVALGYLEIAQERAGPGETERSLIRKPYEALKRSSRIINNVQKLQKVRSGAVISEIIDLGVILKDVQSEYSQPDKNIGLNFDTSSKYPVKANDLLHDVFSNLVGNAVKHSNGRLIDISVSIERIRENGRPYYKVCIEDNGPGIPDDAKAQLFERFQRGNTRAMGTGLGLYLVKSLVDSYDGMVLAEDRIKGDHAKGTRFIVMLPALDRENDAGSG